MRTRLSHKFAKNFKKIRLKRGLSQETLAEKAGLTPQHVGVIERCEKCPTLDTVQDLSRALGCRVTDLLGGV